MMATAAADEQRAILELSSLSLYKLKANSISSLANQNERRREVLQRQKDKRQEQFSQLRFTNNDETETKPQWPRRKKVPSTCPIGMMLAEWLFTPPEDISSWFVIPCPRGQRCLVVVQSHRTNIYGKHGNLIWTMYTNLPKQTILYCIYDNRRKMYHIIDLIMWNGQDYSTQIECQCRFFMLLSLIGDSRLRESFEILSRWKVNEEENWLEAEDGYLFYHPLGFYENDYSPLVCWLKPFMIEEILSINIKYPIEKPIEYTTAQTYMFDEQSNRQSYNKKEKKEGIDQLMSVDE